MQSMFGARVLFLLAGVGFSVLAGCARDPVIPAADIPAIPPSTRSAMHDGGGGSLAADSGPGFHGPTGQGGQAGLGGPIIPSGGGKGGAGGKGSPFPAAPSN